MWSLVAHAYLWWHDQRGTGPGQLHAGGPNPPSSCTVAVRVCDNGTPNLCATRSTTIAIIAVNDPPVIISLTGGTAVEDQPFTVDATAIGP